MDNQLFQSWTRREFLGRLTTVSAAGAFALYPEIAKGRTTTGNNFDQHRFRSKHSDSLLWPAVRGHGNAEVGGVH